MKALALTVDGERGYLFEASRDLNVIAFVPEETLSDDRTDELGLDEAAYLLSGWAARNARFNSGVLSKHTFPALNHPVLRADERGVTLFLQRLRHAYTVNLISDKAC
jgi:hypothetical protein